MAPVSQWNASPRAATPRLRRADRLVIGSFDGAAHLFQRRARTIMLGAAVVMVPMLALNLGLSIAAFQQFDRFDSLLADKGYLGAQSTSLWFAVVLQSFTAHVLGALLAPFVAADLLGVEPRMRTALLRTARRLPALLVTWALTHWWVLLIALGAVNAREAFAAGIIVWGPLIILGTVPFTLVAPALAIEGLGMGAAIGRSWRFARQRFGAVYAFVLLCTLLGGVLFGFIAMLPQLLESTELITFGSIGYLVQGVTVQLALLVVLPLVAMATGRLFVQLRVHVEGVDILLAADRAFGGPA